MDTDKLSAKARTIVRKKPAKVFAAFSDAKNMSKFWFTRQDQGLKEGEPCTWSLGSDENAFSFEILVKEIIEPSKIVIEWVGLDGNPTRVSWTFEETDAGDTILAIEETGFSGSNEAVIERVVDSTCGFNQVIIAAKALVEHGVALNVVADHA